MNIKKYFEEYLKDTAMTLAEDFNWEKEDPNNPQKYIGRYKHRGGRESALGYVREFYNRPSWEVRERERTSMRRVYAYTTTFPREQRDLNLFCPSETMRQREVMRNNWFF